MDALGALLFDEGEELCRRTAEVEDAYARIRGHAPEEIEGYAAPSYAEILTALRYKDGAREETLLPRRVLVRVLANLEYYFFKLASGHGRVYDMPHLTDEERAAEHSLRHDLSQALRQAGARFDVSLSWTPNGYDVDENGELVEIEAEFTGIAAIGYGYDTAIFHEGHADDEEYVRGFVEGCLERLVDQDESKEAEYLGGLWEAGEEDDREYVLEMLKDGCEVREGATTTGPSFPSDPPSVSYYVER